MAGSGTAVGRGTALLVAGTFFMENLDGTILTTAVPSIARSLQVPAAAVGTAITAYLVTLAVLIPLSGWLTERFGARRVLLTAIALFTLASALCAVAPGLPELIAARVLQGVGGAMMVPVGRLVVLRETAKADLVRVDRAAHLAGARRTGARRRSSGACSPRRSAGAGSSSSTCRSASSRSSRPGGWSAGDLRPPCRASTCSASASSCVSIAAVTALGSVLAADDVVWPLAVALAVVGLGVGALAVRHLRRCGDPARAPRRAPDRVVPARARRRIRVPARRQRHAVPAAAAVPGRLRLVAGRVGRPRAAALRGQPRHEAARRRRCSPGSASARCSCSRRSRRWSRRC